MKVIKYHRGQNLCYEMCLSCLRKYALIKLVIVMAMTMAALIVMVKTIIVKMMMMVIVTMTANGKHKSGNND